jgi:hypothetical protein
MLNSLRRLSRNRFGMLVLLVFLTWPVFEFSQEIGIYTTQKLQAGRLH